MSQSEFSSSNDFPPQQQPGQQFPPPFQGSGGQFPPPGGGFQPQSPYGYGYNQWGDQPVQKKPKTFRNCVLIFLGLSLICIIICCVGMFVIFQQDETMIATWGGMATAGSANRAVDVGVVCEGSQAAAFSEEFQLFYGSNVEITMNEFGNNEGLFGNGEGYLVTGTLIHDNESFDYSAIFIMGDGNGMFGIFGNCIEGITQLSPSFSSSGG